ncbi:MAG: sigma-70 family RNA polymerase sigma factor [Ignavibacteriales bacterium]|nr:sigma-70 family RNA polymerase sigma factor [Ignavibacteriales bacterium]
MSTFQETNSSASFEELVNYFKNPLLNYLYRFIGDRDIAEDILQDTFIKVYRKKELYNGSAKVSTWIYTIAGNLAKSEISKRNKHHHLQISTSEDDEKHVDIISPEPQPDRVVDSGIKAQFIQDALLKVPEIYREAVILRDIQELSYEEIAEMLDITVGTVKSRISRGRAILQELLRPIYKDDI